MQNFRDINQLVMQRAEQIGRGKKNKIEAKSSVIKHRIQILQKLQNSWEIIKGPVLGSREYSRCWQVIAGWLPTKRHAFVMDESMGSLDGNESLRSACHLIGMWLG